MNRNKFIREATNLNRKFEVKYLPEVRRAIHFKVEQVIAELRRGGTSAAMKFLHTDTGNPKLTSVIRNLYLTVGKKHAQVNYMRIKQEVTQKGFGFNQVWADFILHYLQKFLTEKITFEIAQNTRDALLKAIAIMITEGLSVDGMIIKLEDWPYEQYQAARIVRTEVNRASNVGQKAQASTSQYQQMKEWISVHDSRTRGVNPKDHADHIGLDGTKINEDDKFTDPRNGDRLDFPGDPSGLPESTINCRCQSGYTLKRDANGNPIPKRRSTVVLYPGNNPKPHTITI